MDHPAANPPSSRRHAGTDTLEDSALDTALRATLDGEPPGFEVDAHYQRIHARVVATASPRKVSGRAHWRELRTRAWFPALSFGLGAACAGLLILALRPPVTQPTAELSPLGQSPPQAAPSGVVLQVRFRDDVVLSAMRASLRAAEAEVIGGPGALGIWRVRIPPEARERSLRTLAADPAVLQVLPEP